MNLKLAFSSLIVLWIAFKSKSDAITRGNDSTVDQIMGNLDIRIRPFDYCVRLETDYVIYGLLEVKYFDSNQWGTFCRGGSWTPEKGEIACRELGYKNLKRYYVNCGYLSDKEHYYQKYTRIDCVGNENSLKECNLDTKFDRWCAQSKLSSVAIGCNKFIAKPVAYLNISFLKHEYTEDSNYTSQLESTCSGIILVNYNEQNGYISSIGFDEHDGNVICRQLGFYKYMKPLPKNSLEMVNLNFNSTPILMTNLKCRGNEADIKDCTHREWGPYPQLEPYGVVSVQCQCEMKLTCDIPTSNDIRLSGGLFPWEGRVEVYDEETKEWGRVCSKTFNMRSSEIVCRQLGYGNAIQKFRKYLYLGRGLGPTWFKNIRCKGTENNLRECDYNYKPRFIDFERYSGCHISYYYYYYLPSAKVFCEVPTHESRVRLAKSVDINAPLRIICKIVEFEQEGNWVPHCCGKQSLKYLDVKSICREAIGAYAVDVGCTRIENYTGKVLVGEFKCPRGSCYTSPCRESMSLSNNCSSGYYTYVCCKYNLPDLIIDKKTLINSLGGIRTRSYYYNQARRRNILAINCSIDDKCLRKNVLDRAAIPHIRNSYSFLHEWVLLLRFSSLAYNIGHEVFYPPYSKEKWEWHECHEHYHSMSEFVSYKLHSKNSDRVVAEGHKASFCLADSRCTHGSRPRHTCTTSDGTGGKQGISYGCYDSYPSSLDCQWVDITGVPSGTYILELILNPYKIVPESDFTNNWLKCSLKINRSGGVQLKWCRYSDSDEWNSP